VGQKTHPTSFRTGVNKSHEVIWFANRGAYSEVLKEDYKIRKFFEKKFEVFFWK
jgi:small subunit ribosomal protein S3